MPRKWQWRKWSKLSSLCIYKERCVFPDYYTIAHNSPPSNKGLAEFTSQFHNISTQLLAFVWFGIINFAPTLCCHLNTDLIGFIGFLAYHHGVNRHLIALRCYIHRCYNTMVMWHLQTAMVSHRQKTLYLSLSDIHRQLIDSQCLLSAVLQCYNLWHPQAADSYSLVIFADVTMLHLYHLH